MRKEHFRLGLGLICGLMMASMVFAGFGGTDVYLASVGRGPGSAGSDWFTTIWVFNPNASPVSVQFMMYERNGGGSPVGTFLDTVQPGDTARYVNAVENMFGLPNSFGAIRVLADDRVIVSSRIFSVPAGGDESNSVGQYFSGIPAEFAIGAGESTDLLGVFQTNPQATSDYRYNFGFMEVSGAQATVRATAINDLGVVVATSDYVVGPFEPKQWNISNLVPGIDQENLRISCEVISGSGRVVVFGSGLANESNDPSTFEMSFSESLIGGGSGGIGTVNAGQGLSGGGTSSVVTLDVGAGEGITVAADTVSVANQGITKPKLAAAGGSNGQVLGTDGSGLMWMDVGTGESSISGVTAGNGLTGGGTEGAVVLDVGAGEGISVTGDTVGIANGGVSQVKLEAAGGAAGQLLSTNGSALVWTDSPAGFALPFSGEASTPGKAFQVENNETNGQGWAGFFKNTESSNTYPALVGSTEGSGVAVYGNNLGSGVGVKGAGNSNHGIEAYSVNSNALYAHNNTTSGITPANPNETKAAIWADGGEASALFATSSSAFTGTIDLENNADQGRGIFAIVTGDNAEALYAVAGSGTSGSRAAWLQGDVDVTGSLSKGGGSFRIDHPLDPEHKYLSHSFVESPDMMNVYNGNIVLDENGAATIELPEWFEALNRDFRYQLTAIGAPGPNLYVASEVQGNQFSIAGGTPGSKVSWQVTGIRQDAWANANRIPVEHEKAPENFGKYLHPTAFGVDADLQLQPGHHE